MAKSLPGLYGQLFSGRDVEFRLGTTLVPGIMDIDFEQAADVQLHYGSNRGQPIGYTRGNTQYSCTIQIYDDELYRLSLASPDGDITLRPPEDLTITWVAGEKTHSTVLVGLLWMNQPGKTGTGETPVHNIRCMITGGIEYNK